MKKFLSFILLLISVNSFAQVSDTLLPNHSAVWNVKTWVYDGFSLGNGYYGGEIYEISGPFDWYGETWTFFSCNNAEEGLMRSDSGKVYCRGWYQGFQSFPYGPADTLETLLYDFTMELGDTAYSEAGMPAIVESIGFSSILGVPKKAWFLSNNDTIVQGLGSTMGLFRPWQSTFEANQWLCSFDGDYKDSLGVITNLSYSDQEVCILSFDETSKMGIEVNFKSNNLTISIETPDDLIIYSFDGKVVSEMRLETGKTDLDLNHLENGPYVLRIGSVYSEKFMKN